MSALADALNSLLLVTGSDSGSAGTEKIALYGMIGVLGSALLTAFGLGLNTYLGRRPTTSSADEQRLDLLEDWIRLILGIDPDIIATGHETLQELQHARPRPHP